MHIRWRLLASCVSAFLMTGILLAFAGSAFASLPDSRAYEMVSPTEKGGLSFLPNLAVTDAAGEHVIVDGGSKNSLLSSGVSWMLETLHRERLDRGADRSSADSGVELP